MAERMKAVPESVRSRVGALSGVRDVDWSDYPERIAVRVDIAGARALTGEAIAAVVAAEDGVAARVQVDLATPTPSRAAKRARFESISVTTPDPGSISTRVTLEWNRQRFAGEATGEASVAGEMRASASATISALQQVLGEEVSFALIGVKELRVFDHDLIAVLLRSPRFADRHLIGTSVITDDRRRAAALAVLNATNRAVGTLMDTEG